ncbi:MAG: haloacid dehalogenase type II [Rhodospirillaceae bacterium]
MHDSRPFKFVTFDAYMGLMDIGGSIPPAVADRLALDGAKSGAFTALWRAQQMARAAASNSLKKGRTSFRNCTAMGLDFALAKHGLDADDAKKTALVDAWDHMTAWPDAVEVVGAIKARGYPVAILSNGDQDQLDAINQNAFAGAFDHVLSTEASGYYKPHPSVYELPGKLLGLKRAEILHVAGSGGDVLGAEAFGMACYWSNRAGDPPADPAYPPSFMGADLRGLLEIL